MMSKKIGILFLTVIFTLFLGTHNIFALPEGENVEAGSATFDRPDPSTTNNIPTLNIHADDKTVINFNAFNIAQNETVNFIQPSATASALSRVTGGQISKIFGILNANGVLFLTNPNGIYFAPSAQVNVNTFVASTLDISTNNFLARNYILEHSAGSPYSQILNQGVITGNNIALIASAVNNQGTIIGRLGNVFFISGDRATVTFDRKGIIQVEVNQETSGKVFDKDGVEVKDALANSGTVTGAQVVMEAKVAADIFKNAVNQQGIIKATGFSEQNGIIRVIANRNIQISGVARIEEKPAAQGIQVSSWNSVTVDAEFDSTGNTTLSAFKDILVNADIKTDTGNLELLADADLDGKGSFRQAAGTLIATNNPNNEVDATGKPVGDITIQSSGESTLANVNAAANFILKQGGAPVVFQQWPGSRIITGDSLIINKGVTLNAADAAYEVGKDWINLGNFNPQFSRVSLVSIKDALVRGSNIFYDFSITEPGKIVKFNSGETQAIIRNLTLRGEYGKLLVLDSIDPPRQWKINPQGVTDIVYTLVGDCVNIRGPPLKGLHSDSAGNLTNWDLDPYWTGQGSSENWSDSDNWDTGTIPLSTSIITFDGVTGTNPNKNSVIDPLFQGTITSLTLNGYIGKLTLSRDLTVSGDFTVLTGTFDPGTSTVIFNDPSQISHINGNNSFYNLTCLAPGKKLIFEANTLTTVQNMLTIEGAQDNYIVLESSIPAQGKEFQIYINAVSDAQGNPYVEYLRVTYSIALGPVIPIVAKNKYIPVELNPGWDASDTHIWDGGSLVDSNWATAENWTGDSLPESGDTLQFSGSTRLSTNNNFEAGVSYTAVTITTSGFLLDGNNITVTEGITDSSGSGSNEIKLNVSIGATTETITVNSGGTLTISGKLDSGYGMIKAGTGTLILSGANTFNIYGGQYITISAGILQLNKTDTTSYAIVAVNVDNGLQFGTGITNFSISGLSGAGDFALVDTGNNAITLTAGSSSYETIYSGVMSGSGGLTWQAEADTLTLTGQNTYTGLTTVSNGKLICGAANVIAGAITVTGEYSILDINGTSQTVGAVTITGAGAQIIDSAGGGSLTGTSYAAESGTISTVLAGSGITLTKTTSGTLTLSAANTFTGAVNFNGGLINASALNRLGAGTALNFNGGGLQFAASFDPSSRTMTFTGSATFDTNGKDIIFNTALDGNGGAGSLIKAGSGTLTLSKNNTYPGATTINAGTLACGIDDAFTSVTLSIASGATLDLVGYDLTSAGSTSFSNSGTIKLKGDESVSNPPENKTDSLVQYYGTSQASYTLQNWLYDSLQLSSASATTYNLPATLTINKQLTIDENNTLDAVNTFGITITGNWSNSGTFTPRSGTVTFNGTTTISGAITTSFNNVTINNTKSLTGPGSGTFNVSGNWSNSGTFTHNSCTVTFNGTGAQSITGGSGFYDLTVDKQSGTLSLNDDNLSINNNFTLTLGTFDASSHSLSIMHYSQTGGDFKARGGILTLKGHFTISGGTFTTSNGTTLKMTGLPSGGGINGEVRALTSWTSGGTTYLIAAGTFSTAGGVSCNNIAKWDGQTWSALGEGVEGNVYALTSWTSGGITYLIAGGEITSGDSYGIAQWNGDTETWSALGSGMDAEVRALTSWTSGGITYLIAGGAFTIADGESAKRVALWNGIAWSALGTGLSRPGGRFDISSVSALTTYGSNLIAGGSFTNAGELTVNYIAQWNGTAWGALGTGMNNTVSALTTYGSNLIAGGEFTTADGGSANKVAQWNGDTETWSALGTGMNNTVSALTTYGSNLIAGGEFTTADGGSANKVAQWNGDTETWSALGSGMNSGVYTLTTYGSNLIAGGDFTTAGGVSVGRIAQWNGTTWYSVDVGTITSNGCTLTVDIDIQGSVLLEDALTLSGNLTITSGVFSANNKNITLSGNWDNSSATTFTAGTGTVIFNGSSAQAVTSGGKSFNAITVTNSSSGGVTFADRMQCATFTDNIAGSKLYFSAASLAAPHTISTTLTMNGGSGNLITLGPQTAATTWYISPPAGAGTTITYAYVSYSYSDKTIITQNSSDGGHNTKWVLGSAGTTFTWTGVVSTDWNVAGNWDLGAVPSSIDTVIIPADTPYQPAASSNSSLKQFTINQGQTFSTGIYTLTVSGDLVINGTLNAGSSTITVGGNLIGSGHTITGVSPALSVTGYIGTLDNPVGVNISGTLTIHAGSMHDMVSIALQGSGNYSWQEKIPGFVFVNNNLKPHIGQEQIRATLTGQESVLYRPLGMAGGFFAPMFMGSVAMPVVMPAPAAAITPALAPVPIGPAPIPALPVQGVITPLPAAVLFKEAKVSATVAKLSPPETFRKTTISAQIFTPAIFRGVTIKANTSRIITPNIFSNIKVSSQIR